MTQRAAWFGGLAGVLGSLVMLLVFASPVPTLPWSAQQRVALPPTAWQAADAQLTPAGEGVRVEGPGATMLEQGGLALPASTLRYLHYRVDDLAADARLVVMWRNEDGLQRRLLPRALGGGAIDLGQSIGWQGTVDSLALAILPVDQLSAAAVASQTMTLGSIELRSDNRMSALAALLTDWLAPRPWTGVSINAGGSEFGQRMVSLTLFVACLVAWWLLVSRVAVGRVAARRAAPWILAAGLGVLVFDQARDLIDRAVVARSAQQRVQARPDLPLAADPSLAADIAGLRPLLAPRERVLVHGPAFPRDYSVYLLRDVDAAALLDPAGFGTRASTNGTVFVIAGGTDTTFDDATSVLTVAGQPRAATPLWQGARLRAYRLGSPGATP